MERDEIQFHLRQAGLLDPGERAQLTPLSGGVSAQIVRADLPTGRSVCLKRALPRLRVDGDWFADPGRSDAERASLRLYHQLLPGSVPEICYEDASAHLFVMNYLGDCPTWKSQLLAGRIDLPIVRRVATILGRIHAATSRRPELAASFAYHRNFDQLRLDPYLNAIVARHPSLAAPVLSMVDEILARRDCLIHGDYSPKNLLVTPENQVIVLDHEVAVFADPAFDLAFLLNHLLLKAALRPHRWQLLQQACTAFLESYRTAVRTAIFTDPLPRCLRLLPMLLLARIDGKSPVEYLDEPAREQTRAFACRCIHRPPAGFADLFAAWHQNLEKLA